MKSDLGLIFLTAEQEFNLNIAPGDVNLQRSKMEYVYAKRNQNFQAIPLKKLHLISSQRTQIISVGTSLIPFLEHNDANRSLMGSNMQRQALTLKNPELPLIQTGIENSIAKESQLSLLVKHSGQITYVSSQQIIIKNPMYHNLFFKNLFNQKLLKNILSFSKWKNKIYFIDAVRKSNQNTYLKQFVNVKKKQWVRKGHIIAQSLGTLKGQLALGRNLLVGYIGWEGYNFEDAIVINQRLVNEDLFTSIHLKRYKTFLISDDREEV